MEYIEREALIKMIGNKPSSPTTEREDRLINAFIATVSNFPAADVRPVVTCADCKYNKREVTDLWGNDAIQCITEQTHRRDWFCADGVKREES